MDEPNQTRRTVLKTLGAGVGGGILVTGSAAAHGGGERTPAWLLTDVWEMADRPPRGEEPTNHNSHVPIYYMAPDAGGKGCAQIEGREFREWANLDDSDADFKEDAWTSVNVDQTLHDVVDAEDTPVTEFSPLWHVNFVFDGSAEEPYKPTQLVNGTELDYGPFIDSGYRILEAEKDGYVKVVEAPFVFNCPARPAQGDHLTYCDG